jgi:hypothetical protein
MWVPDSLAAAKLQPQLRGAMLLRREAWRLSCHIMVDEQLTIRSTLLAGRPSKLINRIKAAAPSRTDIRSRPNGNIS